MVAVSRSFTTSRPVTCLADSAYAGLVEGTDGALYGTTTTFGVFKINKDGTGFFQVHEFYDPDRADGVKCYAGVVEGTDGALYGATFRGGAYGEGVIFKVNKDGTDFIKLHDFNGLDGSGPAASLVEASNGARTGPPMRVDTRPARFSKSIRTARVF